MGAICSKKNTVHSTVEERAVAQKINKIQENHVDKEDQTNRRNRRSSDSSSKSYDDEKIFQKKKHSPSSSVGSHVDSDIEDVNQRDSDPAISNPPCPVFYSGEEIEEEDDDDDPIEELNIQDALTEQDVQRRRIVLGPKEDLLSGSAISTSSSSSSSDRDDINEFTLPQRIEKLTDSNDGDEHLNDGIENCDSDVDADNKIQGHTKTDAVENIRQTHDVEVNEDYYDFEDDDIGDVYDPTKTGQKECFDNADEIEENEAIRKPTTVYVIGEPGEEIALDYDDNDGNSVTTSEGDIEEAERLERDESKDQQLYPTKELVVYVLGEPSDEYEPIEEMNSNQVIDEYYHEGRKVTNFNEFPCEISALVISFLQLEIDELFIRTATPSDLRRILFGYSRVDVNRDIYLIYQCIHITGTVDENLMLNNAILFNLVHTVNSLRIEKISNVDQDKEDQAFSVFQNVFQLEHLYISFDQISPERCHVTDSGIGYLATCCSLRTLELQNLAHVSLYCIINMAKHLPYLEKFVVSRTGEEQSKETKPVMCADFESLRYCKKLRHLELDNFRIVGTDFAVELNAPLRHCPLETIALRRAGITSARDIPSLHYASRTLRNIDLRYNSLNSDSIRKILFIPEGQVENVILENNAKISPIAVLKKILENEQHSSMRYLKTLRILRGNQSDSHEEELKEMIKQCREAFPHIEIL